jgi:hypothetical protein
LPYAGAFFADSDSKQALQKICVLGLFLTLHHVVTVAEERFVPSEMLSFLKRPEL